MTSLQLQRLSYKLRKLIEEEVGVKAESSQCKKCIGLTPRKGGEPIEVWLTRVYLENESTILGKIL